MSAVDRLRNVFSREPVETRHEVLTPNEQIVLSAFPRFSVCDFDIYFGVFGSSKLIQERMEFEDMSQVTMTLGSKSLLNMLDEAQHPHGWTAWEITSLGRQAQKQLKRSNAGFIEPVVVNLKN